MLQLELIVKTKIKHVEEIAEYRVNHRIHTPHMCSGNACFLDSMERPLDKLSEMNFTQWYIKLEDYIVQSVKYG